jgi:hypothetical protein
LGFWEQKSLFPPTHGKSRKTWGSLLQTSFKNFHRVWLSFHGWIHPFCPIGQSVTRWNKASPGETKRHPVKQKIVTFVNIEEIIFSSVFFYISSLVVLIVIFFRGCYRLSMCFSLLYCDHVGLTFSSNVIFLY